MTSSATPIRELLKTQDPTYETCAKAPMSLKPTGSGWSVESKEMWHIDATLELHWQLFNKNDTLQNLGARRFMI
jgi:hypothetical protein